MCPVPCALCLFQLTCDAVLCEQGESYDGEILNALEPARATFLRMKDPATLTQFVESVRTLTPQQLLQLETVGKNFSTIQDWFDDKVSHTYGEIMNKLEAIMAKGTASFPLTKDSSVIKLEIAFPMKKGGKDVQSFLTEEALAVSPRLFRHAYCCGDVIRCIGLTGRS